MNEVKILAIDNNADNLVGLNALLTAVLPEVIFIRALSGKEGIELCISEKPDIILLDIVMPEMDGYEVCSILKSNERTKTVPVIMLTASGTDKENRIKILECGADAFISKPIDEWELTAQVRAMLRIKESEDRKLDENERLKRLVEERTKALQDELKERKNAEKALKESETQFREFFEKAADAIFIAEIETAIILDANEAASKLMLMPLNQIIGLHQSKLHPPVTYTFTQDSFKRHKELVEQKRSTEPVENEILRSDGAKVPVEVLAAEVIIKGKKCLMGTFRDITERKFSLDALQTSEANLKAIVENTMESIWSINTEYEILHINNVFAQAFFESFGVKLTKGSNIVDALPLELKHIWKDRYDRAFKNERFIFEDRVDLSGAFIYIEVAMNPIVINGKVVGASFFGRDISERRRAEEAISISEARLKRAEIASRSGNWEFYLQSQIMIASEGAIKLYGVNKNQFGYDVVKKIPLPEYRPILDHALKNLLEKDIPYDVEFKIKTVDTNEIKDIHSVAVYDKEKQVLFGIIQDITERKQAEMELIAAKEKAEESDRLKSAFLANMSHEIRTPLNSIIGFSELMTDANFNSDQQFDFARIINECGTNLLTILTDIMDISKIEAGQVHISATFFSATRLMTEIRQEFSFKAQQKGIELRLNPLNPADDVLIESDEIKLRQILVNLVTNALKFTQKGYVEIGLKVMADRVLFAVKDTGIGIPEIFHKQIFERFRQVESSETRKYGGNGLGLAISKSLVELLGGKIWIESEEGSGSVFYFMIPKGVPILYE
jgi:PAS domain S-box-containing protein